MTVESEGAGRASVSFTPAEEEKFLAMSRTPDIYQKMASSISPSISGDYTVDIKRALACLLFGGSRKVGRATWAGRCLHYSSRQTSLSGSVLFCTASPWSCHLHQRPWIPS